MGGFKTPSTTETGARSSKFKSAASREEFLKEKRKKKRNWSVPTRGGRRRWDEAKVYHLAQRPGEGHERSHIFPVVKTMCRMQLRRRGIAWLATGSLLRTRHFCRQGAVGGVTYISARTTQAGTGVTQ